MTAVKKPKNTFEKPPVKEAGSGYRCLKDHLMVKDRKTGRLYCKVCEPK